MHNFINLNKNAYYRRWLDKSRYLGKGLSSGLNCVVKISFLNLLAFKCNFNLSVEQMIIFW